MTLPSKEIPDDLDLQEGQRVRLGNGAEATVHKRTQENVTIDANHVLAGKTLNFDVELLELTKVDAIFICSKAEKTSELQHVEEYQTIAVWFGTCNQTSCVNQ